MLYRELEISCIEDCGENTGGYYCEVFTLEPYYDCIDSFCIHPDELQMNPDPEYWQKQYLDNAYEGYVRDGLIASTLQGHSM